MKQVHWYPGHMTKTNRLLKETMSVIDIAFILVDARAPISCYSPVIEELYKNKNKLFIFTKADLADKKILEQHLQMYQDKGYTTLVLDCLRDDVKKKVSKKAREVLKDVISREVDKGMKKHRFRAAVVGVPNVGKSTFINQLVNKRVVNVGNRAGVTKNLQWIRINEEFELLDSPGILWPKFESEHIGYALAACKAIKISILPIDDVVLYLLQYLLDYYPSSIYKIFGEINLDDVENAYAIMNRIYKIKLDGKYLDYERISEKVLNDIHKGKFGRVSWDINEKL